jgi:DNA repair and recombination protein RAD54B
MQSDFDIIVCDEGHRLKSIANKSAQAILTLNTERRIILSGTPIQNDLGELYAMIDFLNPGLLGTPNSFKRNYEIPIVRSRQPEAMEKDRERGAEKSELLSELTSQFVLRRSADMLKPFLPPKTDTVVFCKPTERQLKCYSELVASSAIELCFSSVQASDHLRAITLLKKACNTPLLLQDKSSGHLPTLPTELADLSGKTAFLAAFLRHVYAATDEKVVIVSLYTQTLDVLETLLRSLNLSFLRLDGKTQPSKRHTLVGQFNKESREQSFAFLLSSKTGGTGLNLVGASRLVLFDTDWNPSVDSQAMARVHRDGQTRPVFIYRLLATGLIDEKIYQRQITKLGLADSFMNTESQKASTTATSGGGSNIFSTAELKDLFTIHHGTLSNTHDLMDCNCLNTATTASQNQDSITPEEGKLPSASQISSLGGWITASSLSNDRPPPRPLKKESIKVLFEYEHMVPETPNIGDDVLRNAAVAAPISLIFTKTSTN